MPPYLHSISVWVSNKLYACRVQIRQFIVKIIVQSIGDKINHLSDFPHSVWRIKDIRVLDKPHARALE
jgi:hypothetical protein